MIEIEIGRKYEIINSKAGNNGLIVTVTGYAGFCIDGMTMLEGQRWFVDAWLQTTGDIVINHVGEKCLKPIWDGNETMSWEDERCVWVPSREPVLL